MQKAYYVAGTALIAYLVLEAFSFGAYTALNGRAFSFSRLEEQRQSALTLSQNAPIRIAKKDRRAIVNTRGFSLHPYLGYVRSSPPVSHNGQDTENLLTEYGFLSEEDLFTASSEPNTAIVAITGGSVAENLFINSNARTVLHQYLDALPAFRGKKIVLSMLATRAYHEPQQLLAVTYYLAQGGRLDMLINLDGKNEISMPFDNMQHHAFAAFPYGWRKFFPDETEEKDQRQAMFWEYLRQSMAAYAGGARYCVTLSTAWSLIDDYAARKAAELELAGSIHDRGDNQPDFLKGPALAPDKLPGYQVNLWQQSSLQLNYLAAANHFDYFEFLQPNQYVPDSKPLSAEERSRAYEPNDPYQHAATVVKTYPLLLAKIPELRQQGIKLFDLTNVYKNTNDTVYTDACCHVNSLGNKILAHAIGKDITAALR